MMHYSGVTGTPKVLILMQGTVAAHDAFRRFAEFGEEHWYRHYWTDERVLTPFP